MIYVLNQDGTKVLGLIDAYSSAIFTVQYYGLGDFQVITYPKYLDLLLPGNLLAREADKKGSRYDNVMVIEKTEVKYDRENGNRVTVTGRSLKSILCKRIVWEQMNLSGPVEDVIRKVVKDNAVSPANSLRRLPLQLGMIHGLADDGQRTEVQLFGDNVGDWIATVCKQFGYGWEIYIDNGFIFDLYQGKDRTGSVIFSPGYDNLNAARYTTGNYYTAALVGGEGEGTSQTVEELGTASGLDRVETYIDAGGVSSNGEIITEATYRNMLINYGKEEVAELNTDTSLDAEIAPYGAFNLGDDYFLGDVVKIELQGIQARTRITEIIYSEDEMGARVLPTFAEMEV